MAYSVAQRTRELGIRIAIGAGTGNVLGMVLKQGAVVAGLGLGVGLAVALASLRVLENVAYDVAPTDPGALVAAGVVLAVISLAAAFIPAWTATRVEPITALKED